MRAECSPEGIDKMRHALGVQLRSGKWSKPYRNHFVAGDDDVPTWEELTRSGLAVMTRKPSELTGGSPSYAVTARGRKLALDGLWPKTERPYRLITPASALGDTPTFATEEAARGGVNRLAVGTRWKIARRLGSRHSRRVEVIAEGVRG